jgi:hypothetical protein
MFAPKQSQNLKQGEERVVATKVTNLYKLVLELMARVSTLQRCYRCHRL